MKIPREVEAMVIAVEHVFWAARQGLTAADVLHGLGLIRKNQPRSWATAIRMLAHAYRRLPPPRSAAIPKATSSQCSGGPIPIPAPHRPAAMAAHS